MIFGMNEIDDWRGLASPNNEGDAPLANYSLTIGEASSLMLYQRCKFASNRKVQRMCKDGLIDCRKITTTRNGQPVSEWLVNEASLLQQIETNEIKWDQDALVAGAANGNASRSPMSDGDAIDTVDHRKSVEPARDAVAMLDRVGNAFSGTHHQTDQAVPADGMATPVEDGDALDEPIGETRSLASVLIENAKLTAQLQGTENMIEEIRGDKEFLRDELKEARAGRKDVTAIAQRMLETLETIAIGGKLIQPNQSERSNETPPSRAEGIPNAEVVQTWPGDKSPSASDPFEI